MRTALLLLFCLLLFSCTLQKRRYLSGFYLTSSQASSHTIQKAQPRTEKFLTKKARTSTLNGNSSSRLLLAYDESAMIANVQDVQKNVLPNKTFVIRKIIPKIIPQKNVLLLTIQPNHVPKAGLRTFIFGLIFLAGAYYCFLHFPELVYITVALLIIAFVFTLVSLISSAFARKDKINNTKGWLAMAVITMILDVLQIAAIALLFILLF